MQEEGRPEQNPDSSAGPEQNPDGSAGPAGPEQNLMVPLDQTCSQDCPPASP